MLETFCRGKTMETFDTKKVSALNFYKIVRPLSGIQVLIVKNIHEPSHLI